MTGEIWCTFLYLLGAQLKNCQSNVIRVLFGHLFPNSNAQSIFYIPQNIVNISWLTALIPAVILRLGCNVLGAEAQDSWSSTSPKMKWCNEFKSVNSTGKPVWTMCYNPRVRKNFIPKRVWGSCYARRFFLLEKSILVAVVNILVGCRIQVVDKNRVFWLFVYYGNMDLRHHWRAQHSRLLLLSVCFMLLNVSQISCAPKPTFFGVLKSLQVKHNL